MSKDEYLITDAPLKALTFFAMPMIIGSFFQQIYNMADSVIVGQFVGSSALAAVGACAALTNVFICVALGAGVGACVLVSRYFGAREYGKKRQRFEGRIGYQILIFRHYHIPPWYLWYLVS